MPADQRLDTCKHQVLRGQRTDKFSLWRDELTEASMETGCFDLLFPQLAPERDLEEWLPCECAGTWQSLALRLKQKTAVQLLSAFVSGPMWAYLLAKWPNDDLLGHPAEVVQMAKAASVAFSAAPASERERNRMLFELENGKPEEYPSEEHFREAKEWLEVAVHLSTSAESVAARRRARVSVTVKPEAVHGPSMGEIPNSSARRRRRHEADETPESPERRRVKLEP
ncbi:hypothetical protein VP1G_02938 [Cytospora mali]|uniref:Uncharacterized protein n=1 Tax=Cytospora mali TaxID=578113 RepID=A0A194UVD9_CYTMA|nr:hypothetical protein VP1G_02938 [Valsa mali var. pyri (nom. inval.)]